MAGRSDDDYFLGSDDPLAQLDTERKRLEDLGRVWKDGGTTVRSRDRSFTMTFDGRGDLTDLTFHGTKYRTMAPPELAGLLVETLNQGRAESMDKMFATMGPDPVPGVDLRALATGKVDPSTIVDALIGPMIAQISGSGRAPRG